MQPLISPVDHESRHSSYRADDAGPSETTPLLSRFPQDGAPEGRGRSLATSITVGLLLTVLLSGVVIGTYLLIEQGREENVLPPVEMAVRLVGRTQWDRGWAVEGPPGPPPGSRRHVVALQTDSDQCWSADDCAKLLQSLMNNSNSSVKGLNFAVSPAGQTYEVLGWRRRSPLYPDYADSPLVLAFIGNFTEVPPSRKQVDEAKWLLDESVSQQYLRPNYKLIGKRTKHTPKYLFDELRNLPQWDESLSGLPH